MEKNKNKFSHFCKSFDINNAEKKSNDQKPVLINFRKKFKCEQCDKVLSGPYTLTKHVEMIHQRKINHKCKFCSAGFYEASTLKKHVIINHEKRKDFKCVLCNKACSLQGDLNRHYRQKHFQQEVQVCDLCGKSFEKANALHLHKEGVHGSKIDKFKCDLCDRMFCSRKRVSEHRRIHGPKRKRILIDCTKCDKSYSDSSELRRHMKSMHEI